MSKDQCKPILDSIHTTENNIREAEDLLPELLGPVKISIQNFIKREKDHLKQLRIALRACEAGR